MPDCQGMHRAVRETLPRSVGVVKEKTTRDVHLFGIGKGSLHCSTVSSGFPGSRKRLSKRPIKASDWGRRLENGGGGGTADPYLSIGAGLFLHLLRHAKQGRAYCGPVPTLVLRGVMR